MKRRRSPTRRVRRISETNAITTLADELDVSSSPAGVAKARRLYRDAARAGDTTAMFNLAVSFRRDGRYRDAVTWFRRAATQGDPSARHELAKSQLFGLGQRRNPRSAIRTLLALSRFDDIRFAPFAREECLMLVASTLLDGWLVPRDYAAACKHLRTAVSLGSAAAEGLLRDLCES